MQRIIILFFLLTIGFTQQQIQNSNNNQNKQLSNSNKFPFQRTIWTYWNSPDGLIPLVVQICFDNIQKVATQHNFTFICVNQSTVRNYITNYDQQFLQVRKHSVQPSMAHAADLLRVLLIQQQGGIWVDSTTIFLNGLSELQNIMSDKYAHMIVNRFSPQPDALLFYYSQGQNRIQHWVQDPRNSSRKILYNQYPDYEIWAIMAKKNCTFTRDLKQVYTNWTQTEFKLIEERLVYEDIYMHRIDDFGNYLYLNMVLTYMLQKKQQQLDLNTNIIGTRQTVFEYYGLWGLHAEYGPMLTTREDLSPIPQMFTLSTQKLKAKGFNFLFFMKQFGYFRYVANMALNVLINFQQKNITFDNFLASNPDGKWCQNVTWLVKGSIMDLMIRNSKVSSKHKFVQINSQQNQKWQQYCRVNGSFDYFWQRFIKKTSIQAFLMQIFMPDKIHKAKVNEIMNINKDLTLIQWLKMKYNDNSFLIVQFIYLIIIFGILWITYILLKKVFKRVIRNRCKTVQISSIRQMEEIHENGSQNKFDILTISSLSKSNKNSYLKFKICQQKILIRCLNVFILILSLIMYNAVDILGGYDQIDTFFVCILIVFLVQRYIQKKVLRIKKLIQVKYEFQLFYIMTNFMMAYLGLSHIRRNRFWVNWFSLVIGMVGPCLQKLRIQINSLQQSQKILVDRNQVQQQFLAFRENWFKYLVLTFLCIQIIFPNIQNIYGQQGYYIKHVATLLAVGIVIFCGYILVKCIKNKLWYQIARIIVLVLICYYDTTMVSDISSIVSSFGRILHAFRRVFIISSIYLSIGSSIKFNQVQDLFFKKSLILKLLVYFCVIGVQIVCMNFLRHLDKYIPGRWVFIEHWCIYVYCIFVLVLFVNLQRMKRYGSKQDSEYSSVQIDNLSE